MHLLTGRRLVSALIVSSMTAVALTGCGGDQGIDSNAEPDSLEYLLAAMPDTASARELIVYGNLARLRDGDPPSDAGEDLQQLVEASQHGFVVNWPAENQPPGELGEQVGFEFTDIDASIQVGKPPDGRIAAFSGRFDLERIDTALTTAASYADQVETGEHDGVTTYSAGEEGAATPEHRGPLRPIGEALRMGVRDDTLWFADTDDGLTSLLDTAGDSGASLAADDDLAWAAERIDDAAAFTAMLSADPDSHRLDVETLLGEGATPAAAEALNQRIEAGEFGIGPWTSAGLADAPGELIVVLSHADNESAEDNAEQLRGVLTDGITVQGQPWSDMFDVRSIDVEDHRLVAALDTTAPMAVRIFVRDSLLRINPHLG